MFVFSNLAISLDGKISTAARGLLLIGSEQDRRHMMELRADCDAVLNGAETLRSFRKPLLVPDTDEQPHNVVVSRDLSGISPDWPFFKNKLVQRILFAGPETKPATAKKFEKLAEVVKLKPPTKGNSTAHQILHFLKTQFGVQRLLIEGGGSIMWEFVSQGLIEEFHVTIVPKLIGGAQAPTLVDGVGFAPKEIKKLKLAQCRVVGEELYLIYRRGK